MVEWARLGGENKLRHQQFNKEAVKCSSRVFIQSSVSRSAERKDDLFWQLCIISDVTVHLRMFFPDVLDSMARFSVQGVFNYSMLTLSDLERVLYVGAREALFALDPNDISKQLRPQVTHTSTQVNAHTDSHTFQRRT